MKNIFGRHDDVEGLVVTVENVDNSEPPLFAFKRELELLAVIPSIGTGPYFFNSFDRNYQTVR